MKNIAIPLLLANSANVEAQFQGGRTTIEQDRKVAKPILIAEIFNPNDCADAAGAVAAANTAYGTASSSLETLMTEMTPLKEAYTTALTGKDEAVTAVVTADAALATNLAADDAAQGTLLTLKSALDQATLAESAAIAAATAAVTAQTAAGTDLSTATTLQTALSTAATAANTHLLFEQGQDTTVEADRVAASGTHATEAAKEAALLSVYNTKNGENTTALATAAASLLAKNNAAALDTALAVFATAAANAVDATYTTGGNSVAKTKADADGVLTTKSGELDTAAATWQGLAKNVVKDSKIWVGSETYTLVGTNQTCAGTVGTAIGASDTDDKCKASCSALTAWNLDSRSFPDGGGSQSATATNAAATYCYGYQFITGTTECKLILDGVYTVTGSSGDSANTVCKKRDKSVAAAALIVSTPLAAVTVTSYATTLLTSLTAWETQQNLVLTATQPLTVAQSYKGLIDTAKGNAATSVTSTAGTYTTDSGLATTATAALTTANVNLENQRTIIANANTAWQALETLKISQAAETAAQLVIKNNADTELSAQNAVVNTLTTAKATADGLVTTTAATSGTATTTKGSAQTAYDAQVTVASGTAAAITTPLSELATLRATAGTAGTTLATAITNIADQQALIDTAAAVVTTKSNERIAAIVACKEEKYDAYYATLQAALAERDSDLDTIQRLLDANAEAKPARGAAGSRCEKAMSNGTFRPARGENGGCADETLCCGAARIPQGEVIMTIETCQPVATTEFNWAPPRAPMATAMPAMDPYPFTCIQGAKKLAAAASALATAVYMLA